jgi:hypothetical protein
MVTLFDHLVEAERRKDEMVRAEQHRLARQSSKRDSLPARVSRLLLIRIGEILVTWGSQLLARATARSKDRRHTLLRPT